MLARHGRVLAPDLAGFGRTAAGIRGAGLSAQGELLGDLLAGGPAILIGSSMGGALALVQAARAPSSVTGLVLSGALLPAFEDGRSPRAAVVSFTLARLRRRARGVLRAGRILRGREAVVAAGIQAVTADPRSIDPIVLEASEASAREQGLLPAARAYVQAASSTMRLLSSPARFAELLDRVRCPVLVIHGRDDPIVPVRFAAAAARAHPAWRMVVLDGVGHLPHLERRDEWLAVVEPWIGTIADGGARPPGGGVVA